MDINENARLKNRLQNYKTVFGITLILGWVIMLISIINEGFDGATFIFVLAIMDATLFWAFMRRFLIAPTQVEIKTMRTIFISFVIVWIIAVGTSFLIWGELYAETIIGIILFLVCTFLMNQFLSDGNMYILNPDEPRES